MLRVYNAIMCLSCDLMAIFLDIVYFMDWLVNRDGNNWYRIAICDAK